MASAGWRLISVGKRSQLRAVPMDANGRHSDGSHSIGYCLSKWLRQVIAIPKWIRETKEWCAHCGLMSRAMTEFGLN